MPSIHDDVLSAVLSRVTGLGITYLDPDLGQTPVPARKRKVPGVEEQLDTLPLFCIAPARTGGDREHANFEGYVYQTYPIEIALVSQGNMEPVHGLSDTLDWRQRIARAFPGPEVFAIREVWDVDVEMGLVIEPGQVNAAYDYGGLTVLVKTCELES